MYERGGLEAKPWDRKCRGHGPRGQESCGMIRFVKVRGCHLWFGVRFGGRGVSLGLFQGDGAPLDGPAPCVHESMVC